LIDLHAAEATAELWRNQKPLLAQSAQLVQAQVQAGEVSSLQGAQARIELNRAELAVRDSERAVVTARSRLAEAIGVPLLALAKVRYSYRELSDAPDALPPAEARRLAARNRADLLAALASYAATQSALQGEIARQYPDLSFSPGYELDQGEGKWSLGLGVTLPVFHQNQGPIAAAHARREAAAGQFLAVQNRVLAEVDRALSDYDFARGDLETVKAMRTNLEQQARTIRAQQVAGETSRLEFTRAQIELADNARAELEARIRTEKALGALEDALQRPLAFPGAWRDTPRAAGN
jgi:outer membrane protein TolC